MSKRALRRHHRQRRIRAEYLKWLRIHDADQAKISAQQFHNRRTPCSCSGCGNPRRWFGEITMQERRALDVKDFEND